ncbi:hypothetical protein ACFFKH_01885 [Micromonospora marina]|uniref:hypothetical protein n=1 Tax=Micromonospora marina TaxID=307120 RepID=UPI00114D1079|nr:hypothetical protein [Micromonospora marina]
MNQPETFEDRLLAVLEAEVAEMAARSTAGHKHRRSRARRVGVLAGAGALAVAGAVGVPVVLGQQAGSTAWAVESRDDGSVEVRIREFKDPAGLERRLAKAGIAAYVTFVPQGKVCFQSEGQGSIADYSPRVLAMNAEKQASFVVRPDQLRVGERLQLMGASDNNGRLGAVLVNVVHDGERCKVQTAEKRIVNLWQLEKQEAWRTPSPAPSAPSSPAPHSSAHPSATPTR